MKGYQCDRCKRCYPCTSKYYKLETYSVSKQGIIDDQNKYDLCPTCYKNLIDFLTQPNNVQGDNYD